MKKLIKARKTAEKNPEKKPKTTLKKSFEEEKMNKYKKKFYTDDDLDEPIYMEKDFEDDEMDASLDLDADDLDVEITDMDKFEEDLNAEEDEDDY